MKFKELYYKVKPPCDKCPYKLGQVHTPVNPCPMCKINNYQMFDLFRKSLPGNLR